MFDAGAQMAVHRTRAIHQHILTYFKAFAHAGHHIVHTTPIYEGKSELGWTCVDFRVVSRTTVTIRTVTHKHEAPVIVVVGMTHGRPLPHVHIDWHGGLVIRTKTVSYGAVTLARTAFLESILSHLAVVNAKTTIVPRFPKADEEEFNVSMSIIIIVS
jgi:hypothetical protein